MTDYVQQSIEINKVAIPVILDHGLTYYPISYLCKKLLLRQELIHKSQYDEYKDSINNFKVVFGDKNVQNANCIEEGRLKERLLQTQIGRLSTDQKISQNELHRYLGVKLLSEREDLVDGLSEDEIDRLSDYNRFVVESFLDKNKDCKFQLCSKCDKYYPLSSEFFPIHTKAKSSYTQTCKVCLGILKCFNCDDDLINILVQEYGEDGYSDHIRDPHLYISRLIVENKIKNIPEKYINKDDYILVVKALIATGNASLDDMSLTALKTKYRLNGIAKMFDSDINKLHAAVFGEESVYQPWKYPRVTQKRSTNGYEYIKKAFNYYLTENEITIEDSLRFDYGEIMTLAKITCRDLLGFIVRYNEFQHPGFLYTNRGVSYYDAEENILFDLRYLIEKIMKLEIPKIPLYLTKSSLKANAPSLYHAIVTKNNETIFKYIDKLYPDKFIELDFGIGKHRNNFDSVEEEQIHGILEENLSCVVYNKKDENNKRLFNIMGMEPDWVALGDSGCWIIEYFGMYVKGKAYNTRTSEYTTKTDEKIKKYERLDGYRKVYLFPEDLKDNFAGVNDKIKIIN